ncbi:MAG: hypothetical protein JWQ76_3664 [Ramlibacter sp.]|nr:hypothetical protein [Ramlibacter sp.]
MFGGGALFGLLAGAALYAPPDLGNQPPPWAHWARDQGGAAAATRTSGAGPAQPPVSATAPPASAAPEPVAAVSDPVPVVQPVPAPQVASSAQPPAKVAKKRKVQSEEPHVDTSVAGAGPAPDTPPVEPEALRAPAEYALPRSDGEGVDASR